MATVHRDNIPNVELVDDTIRKFASQHGLQVSQQNREPDKNFPDWELYKPGEEKRVMIWPGIYGSGTGIFVCPYDPSDVRIDDRESRARAMHTGFARCLPELLEIHLRYACSRLGWYTV